ncbi:TlpA family protein disulfide reductase [Niabella drilacis]|uniref:Redoxin n=1 Tax=Niabella drilacis (strain DSM 25811 / CCM 8410 / CCUG 62505 / LMG 26954 / E90) TaxID=1285928 RepID=A0A1G6YFK2_NIADE|nr:TlpA disulfide reductase family protein [Niabella drilacis]SDD88507.1 Redoxin [Niabella drilacis]
MYTIKTIFFFLLPLFISIIATSQDRISIYLLNTDRSKKVLETTVSESTSYPYPYIYSKDIRLVYNQPQKVELASTEIQVSNGQSLTVWNGDTIKLCFDKNLSKAAPCASNDSSIWLSKALREKGLNYFRKQDTASSVTILAGAIDDFYKRKKIFVHQYLQSKDPAFEKKFFEDYEYERLNDYLSSEVNGIMTAGLLNEYATLQVLNKIKSLFFKTASNGYRMAIYSFATYLTIKDYPDYLNQDEQNLYFIKTVKKYFNRSAVDFLLMQKMFYILHNASNTTITSAEMVMNELRHSELEPAHKRKAQQFYDEYKKSLKKLPDILQAKLKTTDGKTVTLGSVIKTNRPLFIDFWATWCGPCIQEFPYLLKAQAANPPVTFISLSIDEDEERWKKFVKQRKLDPRRTFLLADYKDNLLKEIYAITNVPRFILFNAAGKCLSANFNRPSESDFNNILRRTLK